MGKADISSKRLIGLSPDGWVKWVTRKSDTVAQVILDSEFQWLSRDSDILIKAYSPEEREFISLTEVQFRPDTRMPVRIRAYAALAEEKYNLPVHPVVVNIFPPPGNTPIPTRYESTIMGLEARQDYEVINLWEIDAEVAFQPELKALLPLATVMKGGANETILRRAAVRLQREERSEDLQRLLGIFSSYVLGENIVEKIMNFQTQALLESTWGQEILKQGLEEGRQEGEVQEAQRLIQRQIRRRFGEVSEEVTASLQRLNREQLETIGEMLMDVNSLEELMAAFPPVTDN
ncbi:Rpn family recombination-promoting nuclease/putative transposase [Phormidium pseudopriestleyi FRX01]|uniref:Rpn family recombination-promoting nuclease/putative transposase n=1 Tax=Phormidium pseudopriestleyi FRX01 TaxID=1759528 RepID=A0ABS3FWE1_9CYAN|nr:DUF4351 domain-containing protein [Phormidium pseudopriestleyi]MBO0351440.1 Rpn family recombination-promoting nuclease/putative transposase [Phormidium pseudopriestleyi FRX01]